MGTDRFVLVTGAGGFIGGHLVGRLLAEGRRVKAVDVKPRRDWWQWHEGAVNRPCMDLRSGVHAWSAVEGCREVYDLAADMGGMGFIESHKLDCMRSALIGLQLLEASARVGVQRFFFSSSACVYPGYRQEWADLPALRESDAYPADPEDGYGWEKLFIERLCRHYGEETPMQVRVARYHNVYGEAGSWTGGREKAPAAICRKVAEAKLAGTREIDIWGDGEQTRSFMFVDDCVEGTLRIMASDCHEPLNLGSDRLVTINQLVAMVQAIAGTDLRVVHVKGPLGVRGRNSDNALLRSRIGWEPQVTLEEGLERTYRWVADQVAQTAAAAVPA